MYQLSKDRQQICLGIIKGHERRIYEYKKAYQNILQEEEGAEKLPHFSNLHSPSQEKAQKLLELESRAETKRILAVERACSTIGEEIQNDEIRGRLCQSILLNCVNGKEYPFEKLNLTEFSRMDFYRRKHRFLYQLALYLDL